MSEKYQQTPYGLLPSSLSEGRLGDLCVVPNGVQTGPFGSQLHKEDYVENGTPIITVEHLGENRIVHSDLPRVSEADRKRLAKYSLQMGDIVFSRVGSVDRRAIVQKSEDGWLFSGRCLRVRPDPGVLDSNWLSYFFGMPAFKNYIRGIAVGATMPSINTKILSDVPIYFPNLDQQREAGKCLNLIDDKIQLNQQINQTLEQIAQAIFKSWFVDFEPVKAKIASLQAGGSKEDALLVAMQAISGKNEQQLTEFQTAHPEQYAELRTTAALFPDDMEESELGEIPKGWKMVAVNKLIEFNPKEPLRKGTLAPYLDMAALPTLGSWPRPPVLREFGSGMRFRNNDTLMARITPCLENGKTAFVQCLPDEAIGWGSTEFIIMRPKLPIPAEYAYLLARNTVFREHAIRSMTGTSGRQRAQVNTIGNFKVVSPQSDEIWESFAVLVGSIFKVIKTNSKISESLAECRDTLLPKLISGDLLTASVDSCEVSG